jgi:hypothetical protein
MMDSDFQSDKLLELLTDALRAGPGSPQWHDAVQKISASGGASSDEYKLLIEARQRLESGKGYRSVRAGAGFTRKVMAKIEAEAVGGKRGFPLVNVIAAISGLLILIGAVWLGFSLFTGVTPQRAEIQELALTHLATPAISLNFEEGLPFNWGIIGSLPVDCEKDLRPAKDTASSPDYVGGGIVSTTELPAGKPFAVEVAMHLPKPSADMIVQVFVTNSLVFSPERATSEKELVWMVQNGQTQVVLPGGQVEGHTDLSTTPTDIAVMMKLNKQMVLIEANGQRIYAGPNELNPETSRYVGIRFLRRGVGTVEPPVVQSVHVLKQ